MSGMKRGVLASLLALTSTAAQAQAQASADTSAVGLPPSAWVSLAFGQGTNDYMSGGFAGVASAWYATGPIAVGVRTGSTDTGALFSSISDPVEDVAALVGFRSGRRRVFAIGALGYAQVRHPSGTSNLDARTTSGALAYSIQASANYRFVGVVAELFGAQDGSHASFRGVAIGAQLGWFGR